MDALHPSSRSIVELDGRAHHGEDRFQPDRTRDQRLAAEGYVVLRLTWSDVAQREAEMIELIRRTVAARMGSAARVATGQLGRIAGYVGFADQRSQ